MQTNFHTSRMEGTKFILIHDMDAEPSCEFEGQLTGLVGGLYKRDGQEGTDSKAQKLSDTSTFHALSVAHRTICYGEAPEVQ